MAAMKGILGLLALLAVSGVTQAGVVKKASGDINDEEEGELTVAEQLQKANNHLNQSAQNGKKTDGSFAMSRVHILRKTRRCVLRECMWPKSTDGKVYIPYVIADDYTSQELDIIRKGLDSFSFSTCIRFIPRTNQKDFIHIQSLDGCFSFVGHQGDGQILSLSRQGCIYFGTVQHELLHALGFHHEQCRADRDQHIRVLLQNVIDGQDFNFKRINTLNQGTPYDYNSVMHYGRLAFSKDNRNPTMVAVPDPNTVFGVARRMNQNDIKRTNLLYCRN